MISQSYLHNPPQDIHDLLTDAHGISHQRSRPGAVAADHQVRLMAERGPVNDLRLSCNTRILEDQIAHGTWMEVTQLTLV